VIDVFPFAGIPVAVMGLGRSGMASALALLASGAEVWAWDDSSERRAEAEAARIPLVDLYKQDLKAVATIVWSPGIPHTYPKPHPIAERARAAGLEIVCDVELLARSQDRSSFIGVTGTNGKSTTTALVGHILSLAGRKVATGGNLGTPALALKALGTGGIYVLEMSSYQLELAPSIAFDVGVLTNISPDHLERHGGLGGYVAAKKRIFRHQSAASTAVVGVDDAPSRAIRDELAAKAEQRLVPVSAEGAVAGGVYVRDGRLVDDVLGSKDEVADLAAISSLPGRHNWQNAAAAYAATRAAGVSPARIAASLGSFPGLAHRQELVAVIDGIRFVNDSKATNADAAAKALVCYDRIYWLAGGRAKAGGIAPLAPYFGRIAHAYLIGEAADAFAKTLAGKVPTTLARTLAAALAAASRDARHEGGVGAVVLLSPACASWDQFASFEARGEAFKALVASLPGERERPLAAEAAP
jgi:UDP-N-acetylmuramoylalanine--D-glutamate ligase